MSIQLGLPPLDIFLFSPNQPQKIARSFFASPDTPRTFLRPISISPTTFKSTLDFQFALTFAIGYVSIVLFLSKLNASRQHKPWGFSKTSLFKTLVVAHNTLLALFSAWMFYGMCYSLYKSWPVGTAREGSDYYAHVAQMLCETDSTAIRAPGNVKSLWEEGTAYFGWFFYMSKFYEVLDTMIILASGKKSSTLQTYHHAGIMFCTWASLKYASPTYLVGIVLNSGVHTLMYSYFAIQSLGFSIPMSIKRSLTSIQIAQFLVGMVWGFSYVALKYNLGFDITEQAMTNVSDHEPRLAHGAIAGELGDGNKRIAADTAVSCLSDSGEALTFVMTTAYILPLLFLFVQFFVRSYVKVAK